MGLISRVSSRTYRSSREARYETNHKKMVLNVDDLLDSSSIMNSETANTTLNGQQILEENSNFQPTNDEILEYAQTVLQLANDEIHDFLWIAEEGIKAPLPDGWKPVSTAENELYYFNFNTGESSWEHPCDEAYKNMVIAERKKRENYQ